jgi:hypothetical protein
MNASGQPRTIVHRQLMRRLVFHAEDGVEVSIRPGTRIHLAWDEIEFVCVTPAMVRGKEGWGEKPNSLLAGDFRSTLRTRGLLELKVVVRDRRPVIARARSWWDRAGVVTALCPMLDANHRYLPDQAVLTLEIRRARLDHSLDDLLDLLAARCRFDLVVDF